MNLNGGSNNSNLSLIAERVRQRHAVEVVTVRAVVHWCNVEQDNEEYKQEDTGRQTHDYSDDFTSSVNYVETNVRK